MDAPNNTIRLPDISSELVTANRRPPLDRDISFRPFALLNGVGIDPYHVLDEMWRCGTLCDWLSAAAEGYAHS